MHLLLVKQCNKPLLDVGRMLEKFVITSQRGRIYKLFACFPNILSVFVVLVKLIESAVYCYCKINLNFLWVDQWCNKQ